MDIFVGPSRLQGTLLPPPSKSIAHRVLIASALAKSGVPGLKIVRNLHEPLALDVAATISCLQALFHGPPGIARLNCGQSASTLRFLLPVAAALGREVVFTGDRRLSERPLADYVAILASKGVTLQFRSEFSSLPVKVCGRLQNGEFLVPGAISSQYITGLMLALPLLQGDSLILLSEPLQSAPYVAITQDVLSQFGISIEQFGGKSGSPTGWVVRGGQRYRIPAGGVTVEADYSQAAFWLTACFLGHSIQVLGLNPASMQGDRQIRSLLQILSCRSADQPVVLDIEQIPDLAPPLAVAAALAPGRTVLQGAHRLRLKESDRLSTIAESLQRIGAAITSEKDSLIIEGATLLKGGTADAHGDHRIAMALAIAALNTTEGVLIEGADCVNKSYPSFFRELERLGGDVRGNSLG